MADRIILVTGFEPYGGLPVNPSAKVAEALDSQRVDGAVVAARILPVALDGLQAHLQSVLNELQPSIVVSLGLAPDEPVLRLERVGLNLADFGIPDNDGAIRCDEALSAGGDNALIASLPLRAIETRLLDAGIPARISNTAGTYLCNATLYYLLAEIRDRGWSCPSGFIHLPYLPKQAASLMDGSIRRRQQEGGAAKVPASMSLEIMVEGVRLALDASRDDCEWPDCHT